MSFLHELYVIVIYLIKNRLFWVQNNIDAILCYTTACLMFSKIFFHDFKILDVYANLRKNLLLLCIFITILHIFPNTSLFAYFI